MRATDRKSIVSTNYSSLGKTRCVTCALRTAVCRASFLALYCRITLLGNSAVLKVASLNTAPAAASVATAGKATNIRESQHIVVCILQLITVNHAYRQSGYHGNKINELGRFFGRSITYLIIIETKIQDYSIV